MTNCYAVGEVSFGTNSGGLIGQFTIDNPEKCSISNIIIIWSQPDRMIPAKESGLVHLS